MAEPASTPDPEVRTPTVLVVLVVRNAALWLRETLQALAGQTYPRLGVLAVDNASTDGSAELLEQALGAGRVLRLQDNEGVAGSIRAALDVPAASESDFTLLLHDDTALDPDAVTKLVEAAIAIEGVERVGVVGPKVVDWDEPKLLLEVGRSTDRFGHPSTPLQAGEIDQGQYDRVLEVLYVSSCAMLVASEVWKKIGPPDDRFESHHEDLDLCWRARLAGFKVLMTPLARARHLDAGRKGKRGRDPHHRGARYYAERAALASMLKDYSVRSLIWLLPLYVLMGIPRALALTLTRRFEDLVDLLAAWGWNLLHLPSTVRRRVRAQGVRAVPDRSIRRFMESATARVPRWFERAGVILDEQRELEQEDEGEPVRVRLSHQTTSLVRTHPVVVASTLAIFVLAFAYRDLLSHATLQGAAIVTLPSRPRGFFAELLSAYRTTGFGGSQAASPALAALGGLSSLLFGRVGLAQRVLLGGAPVLGAVMTYRALARETGRPVSSVVAAACYSLSAVMLWGFSEGRMDLLVALAVMPVLYDRLDSSFSSGVPVDRRRSVVGLGVALAVGVSFFPGTLLAFAVMLLVRLVLSPSRVSGMGSSLAATTVGAALVFPMMGSFISSRAASLSSEIGSAQMDRVGRLVLGEGPGTWVIAWFLPAAAIIAFSLVRAEDRGPAFRALVSAGAGTFLAWAAAADYLPDALSNPMAYLALAAISEAMLIGYGLSAFSSGIGKESFGYRQIGATALTLTLGGGLFLQTAAAIVGAWGIGGAEVATPAWEVLRSGAEGEYRVLWIGADDGRRFPAPGGDPQGVFPDGGSSLKWAVTTQDGASAIDTGRSLEGPGEEYLRASMDELLSGTTSHTGALLAPLGIRFVVAEQGTLPTAVASQLGTQADLNLSATEGLVIYRNAAAIPPAALATAEDVSSTSEASALEDIARFSGSASLPLTAVGGGWQGQGDGEGVVLIASEFSTDWSMGSDAGSIRASRSFGWATSFAAPSGPFRVTYANQWRHTAQMVLLTILWVIALWITRKPAPR